MANNKKALSKNLILKRASLPLKQMKYKLIYIVCQVFLKKILNKSFPGTSYSIKVSSAMTAIPSRMHANCPNEAIRRVLC